MTDVYLYIMFESYIFTSNKHLAVNNFTRLLRDISIDFSLKKPEAIIDWLIFNLNLYFWSLEVFSTF